MYILFTFVVLAAFACSDAYHVRISRLDGELSEVARFPWRPTPKKSSIAVTAVDNDASASVVATAQERKTFTLDFHNSTHGTFEDASFEREEQRERRNGIVDVEILEDKTIIVYFDNSSENVPPSTTALSNNVDCALKVTDKTITEGRWLSEPRDIAARFSSVFTVGATSNHTTYTAFVTFDASDTMCDQMFFFKIYANRTLFAPSNPDLLPKNFRVDIKDMSTEYERFVYYRFVVENARQHVLVGGNVLAATTSDGNGVNEDPVVHDDWRRNANVMLDYINDEHRRDPYDFGVINGALSSHGKKSEFTTYRESFTRKLKFPIYHGLGKQDYVTNVGRCWNRPWYTLNGCSFAALTELKNDLRRYREDLSAYSEDIRDESTVSRVSIHGSFAYAFSVGRYRFVQLNYYPEYVKRMHDREHEYDVNTANVWLYEQLEQHTANGDHIIVLMQDAEFDGKDSTEFYDTMRRYNVAVIVSGNADSSFATDDTDRRPNAVATLTYGPLNDPERGGYYDIVLEKDCIVVKSMSPNIKLRNAHTFMKCYNNEK